MSLSRISENRWRTVGAQVLVGLGLILGNVILLRELVRPAKPAPAYTSASVTVPVGADCAVELRKPLPRDFSAMRFTGQVRMINDSWLVLRNKEKPGDGDMWIPRDAILFLLTGKAAREYKGMSVTWDDQTSK